MRSATILCFLLVTTGVAYSSTSVEKKVSSWNNSRREEALLIHDIVTPPHHGQFYATTEMTNVYTSDQYPTLRRDIRKLGRNINPSYDVGEYDRKRKYDGKHNKKSKNHKSKYGKKNKSSKHKKSKKHDNGYYILSYDYSKYSKGQKSYTHDYYTSKTKKSHKAEGGKKGDRYRDFYTLSYSYNYNDGPHGGSNNGNDYYYNDYMNDNDSDDVKNNGSDRDDYYDNDGYYSGDNSVNNNDGNGNDSDGNDSDGNDSDGNNYYSADGNDDGNGNGDGNDSDGNDSDGNDYYSGDGNGNDSDGNDYYSGNGNDSDGNDYSGDGNGNDSDGNDYYSGDGNGNDSDGNDYYSGDGNGNDNDGNDYYSGDGDGNDYYSGDGSNSAKATSYECSDFDKDNTEYVVGQVSFKYTMETLSPSFDTSLPYLEAAMADDIYGKVLTCVFVDKITSRRIMRTMQHRRLLAQVYRLASSPVDTKSGETCFYLSKGNGSCTVISGEMTYYVKEQVDLLQTANMIRKELKKSMDAETYDNKEVHDDLIRVRFFSDDRVVSRIKVDNLLGAGVGGVYLGRSGIILLIFAILFIVFLVLFLFCCSRKKNNVKSGSNDDDTLSLDAEGTTPRKEYSDYPPMATNMNEIPNEWDGNSGSKESSSQAINSISVHKCTSAGCPACQSQRETEFIQLNKQCDIVPSERSRDDFFQYDRVRGYRRENSTKAEDYSIY